MKIAGLLMGLLASLCAYSQVEMLPGYIVTNTGDTLIGSVEYSNWTKNPQSITFVQAGGQAKTYSVADLNAVAINGKANYTKAIVSVSTRPLDAAALRKFAMDTVRTDTVLLKNLVSGGLNLYQLIDFKEHYYLQVNGGPITELGYELVADEYNTKYTENNIYRDQVKTAMLNTKAENSLQDDIEKLKYRENTLSDIVGKINAINNGQARPDEFEKKIKTRYFFGFGIGYNHMSASGTGDPNVTNIDFKGMFRPGVQVGVDFNSTRKFKNLILRGEIGYYKYLDTGNGVVPESPEERPRTVKYDVIILLLKPSVNLLYTFVSTPGFKAYAGLGYVGNFSINPRNRMRVDYLDDGSAELSDSYHKVDTYWGQGIVKAGVMIGKRFEAGINFPFAGTFIHYPGLKVNPGNISVQFNYRFIL